MKTAEEILHEKHREIDGWKSWLIIEAMEEYADQFKQPTEVMPSDEEIKDQLIKEQKELITALSDQVALVCGELAIEDMEKYGYKALNVSQKIRFTEINIASLESQLKPADPVQRLKDKGLIEDGCAMDEINKI